MHPAPAFRTTDPDILLSRLRAYPFCTLVATDGVRARLTHTPVLADGPKSLRFHVARTNPVCEALLDSAHALVATLGEHAYIDPSWYREPDQVGTWNYISVEAEGPVDVLDATATRSFLHDLAATFDGNDPWTEDLMTPRRMEQLLAGIAAFRLRPDRFVGTTKLSQNKSPELQGRIRDALGSHPLAKLMGGP